MKKMLIGMAALLGAASANAAIIPTLVDGSPTAVPGGFRFTYEVFLNPAASISNGDGFTIFDFAGFVPGSNVEDVSFDGLDFSFQFTGPSYDFQNTAGSDDASIFNLTWTYTGTDIINEEDPEEGDAPISLGFVSAVSIFGDIAIDITSSGFTKNGGATDGQPGGGTTFVAVPVDEVPEPGMLGLLGLGVLGLAAARRRAA